MVNHRIRYLLVALLVSGVAAACQLSGSKSPTAFTFPTPDLTGTAIYWSVATSLAPSVSPIPVSTATAQNQPPPSSTPIPVHTATSAPVAPTATVPPPTATSVPLVRAVGKIVATYLDTPPNVDGNLSQWTLHQYPADYVVYGSDEWTNATDLSAKVMVGWDTNNLYLGVHVLDNRYVQTASGANIYLGDSLEILLDTSLQADYYVNSLSPDDFQLGISPGSPNPDEDPEAYLWFPSSIKGSRPKVKIAAVQVDGGYDVEVSIPWSVFEITPVEGQHYGFALSVSDNDTRTQDLQESMVSSVPNRRLTNPTTWGDLQLGKP